MQTCLFSRKFTFLRLNEQFFLFSHEKEVEKPSFFTLSEEPSSLRQPSKDNIKQYKMGGEVNLIDELQKA
jgi:hypothetical protein